MRVYLSIVLFALAGCGATVPKGGVPRDGTTMRTAHEGADLVPRDLDLVVRVDLSQIRDALGEETASALLERAAERSGSKGIAREALATADVVWLGLRVADAEAGDRIVVVHTTRPGKDEPRELEPDRMSWARSETEAAAVERFVAREPPERDGMARIYLVGDRDAVFVSPVEAMSVERVLRKGPDPGRGQPEARGLLSVDYRARRLSPPLEQQYPSLAGLWRGLDRIRGVLDVRADHLLLEARLLCEGGDEATKIARFLTTIRDGSRDHPRFGALFEKLGIERSGHTVEVRWPLPVSAIRLVLEPSRRPSSEGEAPEPSSRPAEEAEP